MSKSSKPAKAQRLSTSRQSVKPSKDRPSDSKPAASGSASFVPSVSTRPASAVATCSSVSPVTSKSSVVAVGSSPQARDSSPFTGANANAPPVSARGTSARAQRRSQPARRSPPSTCTVIVSSLSARKSASRRSVAAADANTSSGSGSTARTAPPPAQTSARLLRPSSSTATRDNESAPRYSAPTLSHIIYATSVKEENVNRNGSTDPLVPTPTTSVPAVAPHREPRSELLSSPSQTPARARALSGSLPPAPAVPAVSEFSPTCSSAAPMADQQDKASRGRTIISSPNLHSTASARLPNDSSSVVRRGVVGPSSGTRRNSLVSTSGSTDGHVQATTATSVAISPSAMGPEAVVDDRTTPTDRCTTAGAAAELPEWRRPPLKSILKCNSSRRVSDSESVSRLHASVYTDSLLVAESSLSGTSAAASAPRSGTPGGKRRCVRFDEENLRATGTADTRAFVEDEPGQMVRGGPVDPNDLNKTRHLRSPQVRTLQQAANRPRGGMRSGGWGRDSTWFDNQFGLDPNVRHSPPPSFALPGQSSSSPRAGLSSPRPCAEAKNPPLRTTFKPNPFAKNRRRENSGDTTGGQAVPTLDDVRREVQPTSPSENVSGEAACALDTTVVTEQQLTATPVSFNLQPRKPLLSSYRSCDHRGYMESSQQASDTTLDQASARMAALDTPLSPTERQLRDALTKSALVSHARREVYIASDDASRNALESSDALPINSATSSASAFHDPCTAGHRMKADVPSSESRGLQQFLRGSPLSEDTERGSQQSRPSGVDLAPVDNCTNTQLPPTSPFSAVISEEGGEGSRDVSPSGEGEEGDHNVLSNVVYTSRASYKLPTSMDRATSPTALTATPRGLVLRVNSCPSSLNSSFSTFGRPTIVSGRPSRPVATPVALSDQPALTPSPPTTP